MAFTFFFRDQQTLDTIVDYLAPKIMGQSKIRIWDAGCASGEEPYSLAILLSEKMGEFSFKNVRIYATDINKDFEKTIKNGIYDYSKLQRIPKKIFEKYFESTDNENQYKLIYKITNKVIFELNNLNKLEPVTQQNSLIVCKNVLLHQRPEERIKILQMFYDSLRPDGLLALEQTQKIPHKIKDLFTPVVNNAQIFKKNLVL